MISRELKCNKGKEVANLNKYEIHLGQRNFKIKSRILGTSWRLVKRMFREDWSPEQISVILKIDSNLLVHL